MIISVLLLFLFFILAAVLLFFIFLFLVPALKAQNINTSSLVFSRLEENTLLNIEETDLKKAKKIAVITSVDEDSPCNFTYDGIKDCSIYFNTFEKSGIYTNTCIGFGSCIKSCSKKAISVVNKCAQINDFCDGCGECLSSCPKSLISLIDRNSEEIKESRGKLFKFLSKCYRIFKIG